MMTDINPEKESNLPGYSSYILRCWRGDDGLVHARLIDIRTNVGYGVGNLSQLPDLVSRLVIDAAKVRAQTDASQRDDHI